MSLRNAQGDDDDMMNELEEASSKVQKHIGTYDDFKKRAEERKKKREEKKNQDKEDEENENEEEEKEEDKNKEEDENNKKVEEEGKKIEKKVKKKKEQQKKKKDEDKKKKDNKDGDKKDKDEKDEDKDGDKKDDSVKKPSMPKFTPASIAKAIITKASEDADNPEEVLIRTATTCLCCIGCAIMPIVIFLAPFLALFFWATPSISNNMASIETTESADADFDALNLTGRNPMFQEDLIFGVANDKEPSEGKFSNEGLTYTVDEQYLEMAKLLYDHTNIAMVQNKENWVSLIKGDEENRGIINDPKYNAWELTQNKVDMGSLPKKHKERESNDENFTLPPWSYYTNPKGYENQYDDISLDNELEAGDLIAGHGITLKGPAEGVENTVKFADGTYSGRVSDGKVLSDTLTPGYYHPGDLHIGLPFDPKEYRNGNLGNINIPGPSDGANYIKGKNTMKLNIFNEKSTSAGMDRTKWTVEPKLGVVYVSGDDKNRPSIPFGTRLYIEDYGYGIVTQVDGSLARNQISAFLPTGVSVNTKDVKTVYLLTEFPWESKRSWGKQYDKNQTEYTEEELKEMEESLDDEGGGNLKDLPLDEIGDVDKKLDKNKKYYLVEQKTTLNIPPDKNDMYRPSKDIEDYNFDPTMPQFDHIQTIENIRNMTGHSLMENQIAYLLSAFSVSRGNSSPIGGFVKEFGSIVEDKSNYDASKIFKTELTLVKKQSSRLVWTKESYYVERTDWEGRVYDELVEDYYWKPFSYDLWYLDTQVNPYNENELLKSFFFAKDIADRYKTLTIRHKPTSGKPVFDGLTDSANEGEGVAGIFLDNNYAPLTEAEARKKAEELKKYLPKDKQNISTDLLISEDTQNRKKNGYIVTQDQLKRQFDDLGKEEWAKYGYRPHLTMEEKAQGLVSVSYKEAQENYIFEHILMSDYRDWLLVYLYDCEDTCPSDKRVTLKDKRLFEFEPNFLKKDVVFGYGNTTKCPDCGAPAEKRPMSFRHWVTAGFLKLGKDDDQKEAIDDLFGLPRQEHVVSNDLDYTSITTMNADGDFETEVLAPVTVSEKIRYFARNSLENIEVATRLEEFGLTTAGGYGDSFGFGGGDASGIIDVAFKFYEEFQRNFFGVNMSNASVGRGRAYFNTRFYGHDKEWPWCAMFVSICAEDAGISTDVIMKSASVAEHRTRAEKNGKWRPKSSGYIPKPGDLIIYEFSHIGIVYDVEDGHVLTIEGNTSGKSNGTDGKLERNGNTINTKRRPLNSQYVRGYIEVDYPVVGTGSGAKNWDPNDFEKGRSYSAHVTAYYPYNDAMQGGYKDSVGRYLCPPDQTIAVPKSIPRGTIFLITGTGTEYDGKLYTATDRGGAIKFNGNEMRVDILTGSREEAYSFGRRKGARATIMIPKEGTLTKPGYEYLYRQRYPGGPSCPQKWPHS